MNTLYVGIEVSSKSNVAYLMKSDGSKHSTLTVDNNRIGAQKLVDRITSVLQTLDDPNVVSEWKRPPFTAIISCTFFVKAAVLQTLTADCIMPTAIPL